MENKKLGKEKVSKLLLKFAIPCVLSLLISALYNIVDQIFIGNSKLGYLGNAATSVVFPITIISYAFAWCFGDGAAALMSIRQGQKKADGMDKVIGNCLTAVAIAGVLFMIFGFALMNPLLSLFGASDASMGLAQQYFTIILAGSIPAMASGVLSSIARADGNPGFSMALTVVGAILNIILDPIFIYALDMGIEGAAIATIIGQIVSFLMGMFYVFFMAKTFKLKLSSFAIKMRTFMDFTKLGISTFITQMAIVVTALVGNMMLAKWGALSVYGADIPIAVMGIAMKVFTIVINIVVGLLVGAQPILGYNYGAEKYGRVRECFKIAMSGTLVVGIIATLIFQLCPEVVINIFGSQDALYMEFAVSLFRKYLMLILGTLIIKAVAIFFQAVGEPVKATVVSLTRDIVCFVPLCLILPNFMGIDGALYAAPIADAIGVVVALIYIVPFYAKLGKTDTAESDDLKFEGILDSKPGVIITIARQHGSAGKEIGRLVAKELGVPCYYKEMLAIAAKKSGLSERYLNKINNSDEDNSMRELYLGSAPAEFSIKAQAEAIKEIAKHGSCVIIGRAADYVLRNHKDLVRVFISAPEKYRVKKLGEMYGDNETKAKQSLKKSDKNRASYYNVVSGQEWGKRENYDLIVDSSIGNEATAKIIVDYARNKN